MTSVATVSTRSIDRDLIRKLFVKFSSVYGHLWSSRHKADDEWLDCIDTWLDGLKGFEFDILRKAVSQVFLIHKKHPPTLGELIDLCLKISGVPSEDEIIKRMVSRQFDHPMVKLVYDRIGNWTLKNGTSEEIRRKTRTAYDECLVEFRANPNALWNKLSEHNATPAIEAPSKTLTREEHIGWRERMKEYEKRAHDGKMQLKDQKHPEFPEDKIKVGSRNFDKEVYQDYRLYLMAVPEELVLSLSIQYAYARMKFLAEIDTARHLKEAGYNPNPQGEDKTPPRGSNESQKVYKNWAGD